MRRIAITLAMSVTLGLIMLPMTVVQAQLVPVPPARSQIMPTIAPDIRPGLNPGTSFITPNVPVYSYGNFPHYNYSYYTSPYGYGVFYRWQFSSLPVPGYNQSVPVLLDVVTGQTYLLVIERSSPTGTAWQPIPRF